jgi:hypothetical protein
VLEIDESHGRRRRHGDGVHLGMEGDQGLRCASEAGTKRVFDAVRQDVGDAVQTAIAHAAFLYHREAT